MTENIIVAHNITKIYKTLVDEVKVFEDLNIEIKKGSSIAIVGESGRGKTTLLNILSGLDRPTSGTVIFNNQRIDNIDEESLSDFRNVNVGFVFQHHYLLEDFTTLDNVLIPLRIKKNKIENKDKEYAIELLTYVGLKDRLYHYPDQLSGGEKQRVAFIRALINDPLVVFADEPTGSLDKRNSELVQSIMWNLKEKFNKTFIIATHNSDISKKCEYIINL